MMHAQLAVFDMIGTTVADGNAIHRCLGEALKAVGIPVTHGALKALMGVARPQAIRLLIEYTPQEAAERGNDDYDDNALIARIHADYFDRLLRCYQSGPDVCEVPGATATFRALREEGVKIAVDTGSPRPLADALVGRLGWADAGLIDAVVASNEVPLGRPAPDAIFRAMELTRVSEARSVARIGSSPIDLRQGAAAGCGWVIGIAGQNLDEPAEWEGTYYTHLVPTIAAVPAFLSVPL
ncbi:MAG: HAD hydrolase-like protein [Fibrella sp.]|nr:HAD hydrolase-like protein [Armatimonadota bacterium]